MDWFVLDKNADTTALIAGGTHLYQLHKTGKIWQYTGTLGQFRRISDELASTLVSRTPSCDNFAVTMPETRHE